MSMGDTDLRISRLIAAPRAAVWRAWSDPSLLTQWWCPKPWTTELRAFDLRPGGGFHTHMRGPKGEESGNPGSFLDIVPMERIVFTSVLVEDWRPVEPSFLALTAYITMADEGPGTRYTARVLHKNADDARRHAEMGFLDGWGTCIDQLGALAASLA